MQHVPTQPWKRVVNSSRLQHCPPLWTWSIAQLRLWAIGRSCFIVAFGFWAQVRWEGDEVTPASRILQISSLQHNSAWSRLAKDRRTVTTKPSGCESQGLLYHQKNFNHMRRNTVLDLNSFWIFIQCLMTPNTPQSIARTICILEAWIISLKEWPTEALLNLMILTLLTPNEKC